MVLPDSVEFRSRPGSDVIPMISDSDGVLDGYDFLFGPAESR